MTTALLKYRFGFGKDGDGDWQSRILALEGDAERAYLRAKEEGRDPALCPELRELLEEVSAKAVEKAFSDDCAFSGTEDNRWTLLFEFG